MEKTIRSNCEIIKIQLSNIAIIILQSVIKEELKALLVRNVGPKDFKEKELKPSQSKSFKKYHSTPILIKHS